MLYLIGIGLSDEKDISVKGLEIIRKCNKVYLENYTSKLNCNVKDLELFYGKKIILANRDLIENKSEIILNEARKKDVALLIIGDIFFATTHVNLLLQAKKLNIKTQIIYNASLISAIGITGLSLYKFKISSIPFNNENIKSPYEVLINNPDNHILYLLDLDPENNKYMSVNEAVQYLVKNGLDKERLVIGCSCIGSKDQEIKIDKAKDLMNYNFKKYPQCLIIPSENLHFMEEESLKLLK